ncbi:SurA N-terminal domain-containing protein [Shewanella fidelis]|uniref:Periplasmic chaperone PpiD n=1 Tax=Shewanella fidelis TaxID=173509 RepID=A0AAW8NLI4_9GAMM|nr:SurA N-terminal domain-containing protein [Shewanella fidelis]MDR8523235.1 SurA N-terminal domain-containing protein [Shewanella fidelis]MDW4811439.1 SurA N-terminal domain-containing protein [Shewanella fidelis]MDW4815560.1 SurA N-terminal domain-containing protein [Shewanella fidelis]MDW4819650.1 SurA N-terminal domain-containing protein [Shewanella fidelis]MDW4824376.1 SurA N-terminal domain-containing protein [Shewanella fidelis]
MLEKIREGSQGVIAKSILILVILSFAFTGVSSYLGSSTEVAAATVNGEEISNSALEQAYQNERSRLEQQLGDMFATLAADDNYMQSVKQSVLERLVADKLLDQNAAELGLRVSDEQIKAAILAEPAFQTDGVFDNDRYLTILRGLGYQANTFRDMMRTDMTRRQLVATLVGSEFVLPGEAEYVAELQGQTRDIDYKIIDATPYLADVSVTDEQIQTYYNANLAQFVRPEVVSLDYVELNAADIAKDITVTDAEAQAYYDEHKAQYTQAEKRLAAHILVQLGDDEDAAKAKAEAIYKQLQDGADFAELAKTESEDTFSGEQGGQLDWFEAGVMEPEFDAALFALNKGEYSNVVKTNFGYHIIKALDIQAGAQAPFADVKEKIVAKLQEQQAVDKFYELQQVLADTSYEVPDTLVDAAKDVGVAVETTPEFTRNNPPELFSKPDVLKEAFSTNVLVDGMNSDVLEVAPNHVVVIRVNSHKEAGTMELAEVRNAIAGRLKQEQANEAARKQAQEAMTAVEASGETVDYLVKDKLTRFDQDIDGAIVNKAFAMAQPAGKATVDTVALANGYAVVVLKQVNAAEAVEPGLLDALKQRLSSQYSENDYRAVIASLKAKGEVLYPVAE